MEIYFIRHGKTKGNSEGRYIGSTDDPLSDEGKQELTDILWKDGWEGAGFRKPQAVYVSGLLRTQETAGILFPEVPLSVREGFNECDFGEFENKNYEELKDNPAYRTWIESGGVLAPPGGEAKADFAARTFLAFEAAVQDGVSKMRKKQESDRTVQAEKESALVFVVHGGNIMALLEHYGLPKKRFYDWQVKNGCGYKALIDCTRWQAGERNLTEIRSIP